MLLIAFIIVSCNKDKKNSIHIEGKVFDPNTAEYVGGVDVTIAANKLSSGGIYSSAYEDLATTTTDENGLFVFDFTEEKFGGYQIRASKTNYFSLFKDIDAADIEAGVTYSPTLNIYPVCWLELMIRNAVPYDTNDYFSYSFTSGFLKGYGCCGNTVMNGHGMYYGDTVICKTYGNQNVTLSYNVTKNNATFIYHKTLYCNAFDTTYFVVEY